MLTDTVLPARDFAALESSIGGCVPAGSLTRSREKFVASDAYVAKSIAASTSGVFFALPTRLSAFTSVRLLSDLNFVNLYEPSSAPSAAARASDASLTEVP